MNDAARCGARVLRHPERLHLTPWYYVRHAQVLLRIREQAGAFEHQADRSDDKVNDGSNYKGLMQASDYKKRRIEVLEDPEAKKRDAVAAARQADRVAREQDALDREEREAQRRAKLKAQLAAATAEGADGSASAADAVSSEGAAGGQKKKKKKRPPSELGALSFDADNS